MGNSSQSEQRDTALCHKMVYLGCKIAVALAYLLRLGPIFRRKAFHRVGNPASCELQIIACGRRTRMTGEAELMKCTVEQDTGKIARKRPSGAICPMHARRKPDNEKPGCFVAKGRHRARMIIGVQDLDLIQKSCQSETLTAISRKPGPLGVILGVS